MFASILKIFSLGVREENPEYLNSKIKISNQVAVFCLLIAGLPFSTIFYYKLPALFILSVIPCIIILFVPLLNYFGLQLLGRTIASLNGLFSVGILHGFMVESGGSPLSASIAYELTFSLLPFIIFHPKERKALLTITIIAFVFISCVQFRINLLEMSHGSIDFLKYGIINDFSIISGSLITYFFLWIISNYSFQAEKKQLQFIEEAQQKNNKLKQSQEVLKNSLKSLDESKVKEKNQL